MDMVRRMLEIPRLIQVFANVAARHKRTKRLARKA